MAAPLKISVAGQPCHVYTTGSVSSGYFAVVCDEVGRVVARSDVHAHQHHPIEQQAIVRARVTLTSQATITPT